MPCGWNNADASTRANLAGTTHSVKSLAREVTASLEDLERRAEARLSERADELEQRVRKLDVAVKNATRESSLRLDSNDEEWELKTSDMQAQLRRVAAAQDKLGDQQNLLQNSPGPQSMQGTSIECVLGS